VVGSNRRCSKTSLRENPYQTLLPKERQISSRTLACPSGRMCTLWGFAGDGCLRAPVAQNRRMIANCARSECMEETNMEQAWRSFLAATTSRALMSALVSSSTM
jgi:hypothetical protein